jgi:hypothetical protein
MRACVHEHSTALLDDDGGGGPSVTSTARNGTTSTTMTATTAGTISDKHCTAWPTSTTVTLTTSVCTDSNQTTDLLIVRFNRLVDAMNIRRQ